MAKTMKSVDAVMVGMGWTGSIMARELTKAGLTVVGLERGADKSPREDFALPRIRDELKYRVRQELMLDTAIETHTLRNKPSELALPMRKWDIPPVGDGLGGAGAHWNGVTWRFIPSEFVLQPPDGADGIGLSRAVRNPGAGFARERVHLVRAAYGPISGLAWVSANAPSSTFTPRAMAAISLPAWKQVKSGRSFHANGPHSFTPALIAASCTMLISRS